MPDFVRRFSLLASALALCSCATVGPQFSQEIAASFAQHKMRKLETKNAEIYYPEHRRETAERIAARLGHCIDRLRGLSQIRDDDQEKALIFLTTADFNNAYVSSQIAGNREHMVLPEHLSIELFNLFDLGLTDVGDVACHEAVHYVQLDQTTGLWGTLNFLTGGLFSPNSFTESWFLEGLATYYEGRLERKTGRPHSPLWAGFYEAGIASRGGEVRTGDLSPENRDLLPYGGSYLAGQQFIEYLARTYGEKKLWALVGEQGDSVFSPFGVTLRFKKVYGRTIGVLYDEYQRDVRARQADRVRPADQRTIDGNLGFFTRLAASPSDGATAAISSNRDEVSTLTVRERDGKVRFQRSLVEFFPPRRWVGWSSSAVSGMSFTADGSKLFLVDADVDVDGANQARLFEIDARSGHVAKIWDGFGGALGGSIDPSGARYAFVKLDGDTAELAELDLASGSVRVLTSFSGQRSFGPPIFSPDGKRLVFPLRGADGFDLYLREEGGEVRPLTRDGQFNYSPRWLDAKTIVFLREEQGRAQLATLDVDGGEPRIVSDVPYVALDPAPIGNGEVAFLNREGWNWTLDALPVRAGAPASAPPAAINGTGESGTQKPEIQSDSAYSPFDHLFAPVLRVPFAYVVPDADNKFTEFHAQVDLSGRDRLGFHSWALSAAYSSQPVLRNDVSARFAYGNSQLAPWYLEVGVQRALGVDTSETVKIIDQSVYAFATRTFWTTPVSFGFDALERRVTAPGIIADQTTRFVGPSLATSYFSGEGTVYAGTRRGIGGSLGAAYFPEALGSIANLGDLRGELFGYVPLPVLSRQSFRIKVIGRTLPGAPPGLLQVGGVSNFANLGTYHSSPDKGGPGYFLPPQLSFTEALRGFEDHAYFAERTAIAGARWRLPLIVDRGTTSTLYLLPSFFLSQIDLELFAEGALFDNTLVAPSGAATVVREQLGAAGAALFVRTTLGGALPISLGYQFAVRNTLRPVHFFWIGFE